MSKVRLYRIYFLPIWPEPDFQIDCNFTNLMCKTLRTYKLVEVLIVFLCSSYQYDFLNFWISYLSRPTRLSYYSSKVYNIWDKLTFKSGKTIRLRWDFCWSQISAGFGKSARFRPEPEPKSGTALVQGNMHSAHWSSNLPHK